MYIGVSVCGGGGTFISRSDFKGVLYKISSPSQPVKYVCTTGLI